MDRYDERDTIFSRMELVPGSERYKTYYARRPELEETDAGLRFAAGGTYRAGVIEQARVSSAFRFLHDTRPLATGRGQAAGLKPDRKPPPDKESFILTGSMLRDIAFDYGAVSFGYSALKMECFYNVRGRGYEYGKPVSEPLRNALVYAVEMKREKVEKAPRVDETYEVARGYIRAMVIGMALSYFLRELGYRARSHLEGESELVLPAAARSAGLGEIGRMGLLLTDNYGPRVRLGAVTTDYPVDALPGEYMPVQEAGKVKQFCSKCGICARRCPGKAIPEGEDLAESAETGKPQWTVNPESCYSIWKKYGTDCGICVSVCPYGSA